MKENEKQAIEEMARIIGAAIEFDELDFGMDEKTEIMAEKAAEKFYAEGYRKQSVGEWIFNRGRTYGEPAYYCSNCSEGSSEYGYDKYCPDCGAHMKGEK